MTTAGRNKKVIGHPNGPRLSDRERTVLLLAADGLTDKEIAKSLGISLKTVGTYWDRMRQKSAANSRTQVLATFLRIQVADDHQAGRFDGLFATWEEGVWVVGRDGTTHYANQRVAEILELDDPVMDHKKPAEVLGPSNAPKLRRLLKAARTEPHSVEIASRQPQSGTRWLNLRAAPFEDETGKLRAVVILMKDITVRKRVEYSLHACESSLRFLMDRCSDLVASFDASLKITYVNDAFSDMLNVSECELVGKHVSEVDGIFAPNRRWIKNLERAVKTGQDVEFASSLAGLKTKLATYLIAEPSGDFEPQNVIALTRSLEGPIVTRK